MSKRRKRKPGRPRGATTQQLEHVEVSSSRCPKCGSYDRTAYQRTTTVVQKYSGTLIIRRRTSCKACGQWRIDVEKQEFRNTE